MSRARSARRIAAAAAFGGGGLGVLGVVGYGVLAAEALLARRWIGTPFETPPDAQGTYEAGGWSTPLAGREDAEAYQLAMLGDSSAAGLGAEVAAQTPGALIAAGLADALRRPVRLRSWAVVGATSADLGAQVDRLLAHQPTPDLAVVFVGANDVTHLVRPAEAVRALTDQVRRLQDAGVEAVVGTCPDLGTIEPVAQPLRALGRRWSRQMAAAQTIGVVEAGARTVSLADLLGEEFSSRPGELFSSDRFHPSPAGYARVGAAVLPTVCAAAGLSRGPADAAARARGEGVAPVALAAADAAEVGGTEVAPTRVGGDERGPRGPWAVVRRRVRIPGVGPGRPPLQRRPETSSVPTPPVPEESPRA